MTKDCHIRKAIEAHSNLNAWASVEAILEAGVFYGNSSSTAIRRVLKIIKQQRLKEFEIYDVELQMAKEGGAQ
jgi:hypothetical protein